MTNSSERLAVQHHLELVRAAIEIQEKRLLQIAAAIRGVRMTSALPANPVRRTCSAFARDGRLVCSSVAD
jgi:hypothetical protein